MSQTLYYVDLDQEVFGPYSLDTMKSLRLPDEIKVFSSKSNDWHEASYYGELIAYLDWQYDEGNSEPVGSSKKAKVETTAFNVFHIGERLVYAVMNILFFVLGGFVTALLYFFGGLVLSLTIIGIPAGAQCFKIGVFCLHPFGWTIEEDCESTPKMIASFFLNIIWILFAGIWLAIQHLIIGLFFYITLVGVPFGNKHFELMRLSLAPFGKTMERDYEFSL